VRGQRQAPAALYPRRKTLGNRWRGGWVGPTAGLDTEEKSFASAGDWTPVVHSVVKHYIDCATPATNSCKKARNFPPFMRPEGSLQVYKNPPFVRIDSPTNPVRNPVGLWFKIITLPSRPKSLKWSFHFRPSDLNPVSYAHLMAPICVTCPTHLIFPCLIIVIISGKEYVPESSSSFFRRWREVFQQKISFSLKVGTQTILIFLIWQSRNTKQMSSASVLLQDGWFAVRFLARDKISLSAA
jgi:hypothetical protein